MESAPGVFALVLACTGAVAAAAAWIVVRAGLGSVWTVTGVLSVALGALSVTTGRLDASSSRPLWLAIVVGIGGGLVLYAATAAFLSLARFPTLRRQSEDVYAARGGMPFSAAILVAGLLVSPGEELFWRGLVQGVAGHYMGTLGGAAVALGGYVAANGASVSVPIVLAAVVGGAAWGGLALWTDGVAASIACHAVWTSLMVARPPRPT